MVRHQGCISEIPGCIDLFRGWCPPSIGTLLPAQIFEAWYVFEKLKFPILWARSNLNFENPNIKAVYIFFKGDMLDTLLNHELFCKVQYQQLHGVLNCLCKCFKHRRVQKFGTHLWYVWFPTPIPMFLRHGGLLPEILQQRGFTTRIASIHGERNFTWDS